MSTRDDETDDLPGDLLVIANLVRHLQPPDRLHPMRFHEQTATLAAALRRLAHRQRAGIAADHRERATWWRT